eukprot:m.97030 g.97030  ORF g.97030 m.97030 type:complete len:185 (-) comp15208_c4_seq3:94-648(-)
MSGSASLSVGGGLRRLLCRCRDGDGDGDDDDGKRRSKKKRFKNLERAVASVDPLSVAGFDPVARLLAELWDRFGDVALFFYDRCGGDKIAIVWDPRAASSHQFSVAGSMHMGLAEAQEVDSNDSNDDGSQDDTSQRLKRKRLSVTPKGKKGKRGALHVHLNTPALLQEMKIIGNGLVESVQQLQ